MAWTVVPFLILIAMAVPATSTLIKVYDNDEAELDVLITGLPMEVEIRVPSKHQGSPSPFSPTCAHRRKRSTTPSKRVRHYLLEVDEPLVIPTNTKVRFLITANDVIHSWWVPEMAVKRDAIPGFINEAWTRATEEGIYRGQCTELCGAYHGFMPVVVHAVLADEFDAWMAAKRGAPEPRQHWPQTLPVDELMDRARRSMTAPVSLAMARKGEGGIGNAIAGSALVLGDLSVTWRSLQRRARVPPCRHLAVSLTTLKWRRYDLPAQCVWQ